MSGAGAGAGRDERQGHSPAGLFAWVLVAEHADHLPPRRQEVIFGRAGIANPPPALAAWVGACGAQLRRLVECLEEKPLAA